MGNLGFHNILVPIPNDHGWCVTGWYLSYLNTMWHNIIIDTSTFYSFNPAATLTQDLISMRGEKSSVWHQLTNNLFCCPIRYMSEREADHLKLLEPIGNPNTQIKSQTLRFFDVQHRCPPSPWCTNAQLRTQTINSVNVHPTFNHLQR